MTNLNKTKSLAVRKNKKYKRNQTNNNINEGTDTMSNTDTLPDDPSNPNPLAIDSESHALTVEGLSDQDGNKMFRLTKGTVSAEALVQELIATPIEVWKTLAQQGIPIASSSTRTYVANLVDDLTSFPQSVYVARAPGPHAGAFVMPDGKVIGKPSEPNFRVELTDHPVDLAQAGSLEGWQATFRELLCGEPLFMLAFCCALAGPILRLSPYPKPKGFECYGPSSIGKTTLLDLLASVWGAPSGSLGTIALNWRLTTAGLEAPMRARTFSCLPLDEANSAGFADPKLGTKLAEAAMMLAEGGGKLRFNERQHAPASLVYFSTSNKPLGALLAGVDPEVVKAIRVRFISVPADMGAGLGVWTRLPEGCSSSGEAIEKLKAALAREHGHAAPAFIERLLAELGADPDGLRERIAELCQRFITKTGVAGDKGPQLRRAQAFSVLYATGRLASDWGVIPTKQVLQPLLACFRLSHGASARGASAQAVVSQEGVDSAIQAIRAHLAKHSAEVWNLDEYELPELTDDELDAVPAFLKTIKERPYALLRAAQWDALFGPDGRDVAQKPKAEDLLLVREGLQYQAQVRVKIDDTGEPTRSAPEKDRVYAVLLIH